jgi:hypothetical protein
MKSLLTEKEKLRIRSMHINEKYSLLKEDNGFDDLLPIDPTVVTSTTTIATTVTAGVPKTGTPEAKAFHDWMDANKVNWNPTVPSLNWKKTKGSKAYGVVGQKTNAAWAKFKDEYTKTLSK